MISKDYQSIIDYAKKNNLNFAVVNDFMEIDPSMDLNGLTAIDTDTFEMPCCFSVDRALIVNIMTTSELTPEDTGKSYDGYYDHVTSLRLLYRPQYIVPCGNYIKLMIWCDWSESQSINNEFVVCAKQALEDIRKNIKNPALDFRVSKEGDPTPDIYTENEIETMYFDIYKGKEFDCEIYINSDDCAFPTGHGIHGVMKNNMLTIEKY